MSKMIYTIAVLFLFATIIALRYKGRKSLLIAAMVLFLDMTVFSVVLYIAKCGNYPYPGSSFMILDYKGYVMLSKLRIPFYNVIRMQNMGLAGFWICMPFVLNLIGVDRKWKWIDYVSLIIPLGYMFFYDPDVRLDMFFYLHSLPDGELETFQNIINGLSIVCSVFIIVYMLLPIVRLASAFFSSSLMLKKKQLISLIVSLVVLDIICFFIFMQNPFGDGFETMTVSNLLGFQDSYMAMLSENYAYIWLPVLVFITANIMLISLMKVSVLEEFTGIHSYLLKKKVRDSSESMQGVFHSFKNVIFSVNIIAKQLEYEEDTEKRWALIERLKQLSDSNLEQITNVLEVYKNPSLYVNEHNIIKSLDRVLERRNPETNISIVRNYRGEAYAICDEYVIEEVFENIVKNAEEAIKVSGRSAGEIVISVSMEHEWVVVRITDNGEGIPKKQLKKVFKAFYTTKGTSKNWGVGLNYVYKNIKAMKGAVYIQSKMNEFTTVNVLLRKGGKKSLWKKLK